LQFPIALAAREVLLARVRVHIVPLPGLNRAQFATQLPSRERASTVRFRISVEICSPTGDVEEARSLCKVSLRPLRDLFLDRWRERGFADLLSLAPK
jgi:hypothetical protein